MYFDAVLDEHMQPVFNGTPAAVGAWLKENSWAEHHDVCNGRTGRIMPVSEYIEEQKFQKILALVKEGLLAQDIATDRRESAGMVTRAHVLSRSIVEAIK